MKYRVGWLKIGDTWLVVSDKPLRVGEEVAVESGKGVKRVVLSQELHLYDYQRTPRERPTYRYGGQRDSRDAPRRSEPRELPYDRDDDRDRR